ncbi:hypothetical protein [Methylocaldum marinum]|nr:hypothetical protein [Methylocaldum marinum]
MNLLTVVETAMVYPGVRRRPHGLDGDSLDLYGEPQDVMKY